MRCHDVSKVQTSFRTCHAPSVVPPKRTSFLIADDQTSALPQRAGGQTVRRQLVMSGVHVRLTGSKDQVSCSRAPPGARPPNRITRLPVASQASSPNCPRPGDLRPGARARVEEPGVVVHPPHGVVAAERDELTDGRGERRTLPEQLRAGRSEGPRRSRRGERRRSRLLGTWTLGRRGPCVGDQRRHRRRHQRHGQERTPEDDPRTAHLAALPASWTLHPLRRSRCRESFGREWAGSDPGSARRAGAVLSRAMPRPFVSSAASLALTPRAVAP